MNEIYKPNPDVEYLQKGPDKILDRHTDEAILGALNAYTAGNGTLAEFYHYQEAVGDIQTPIDQNNIIKELRERHHIHPDQTLNRLVELVRTGKIKTHTRGENPTYLINQNNQP